MAKKLTTQTKLKRLRAEGYSRKELANAFGVSVSSIGRAERGQSSGKTVAAQVAQFVKLGKRAKQSVVSGRASLPSAPAPRPARAKREKIEVIVTPIARAEGKLSLYDSDTKVVVYVDLKDGTRHVLYSKGGIEAGDIGDLESAIESQTGAQYRGRGFDKADIVDVKVEEY